MMASKAKKLSPVLVLLLAILCFVVGAAAGFLGAARDNYLSPVDEYAEIAKNGRRGNVGAYGSARREARKRRRFHRGDGQHSAHAGYETAL